MILKTIHIHISTSSLCGIIVDGDAGSHKEAAIIILHLEILDGRNPGKEGKKLFVVGTKESVGLTDKEKAVTDVKREEVYRQPLNLKQDKATKSSIIYLKMSCDFRLHQDLATLLYSIDGKTWIPAIKDFKMQYDYRRLFMGTRIAIYNYATKAAGGHVDVDSFEYSKRK